jgi:hypothetical protein
MSIPRIGLITLVLLGCASSTPRAAEGTTAATHPENSGGGHGHRHHDFPAPVTAYHDVLAPLWHSDPGAARDARTCEQAVTLGERASAVQAMPVPERAQEAAWRSAVTQIVTTTTALGAACGATPRGDIAAALGAVHTAFHSLLEPLGQGHH